MVWLDGLKASSSRNDESGDDARGIDTHAERASSMIVVCGSEADALSVAMALDEPNNWRGGMRVADGSWPQEIRSFQAGVQATGQTQ